MKSKSLYKAHGFTMLEVLIALALFGIVATGMVPAFITHLKYNTEAEIRSSAIAAAQLILDELRVQNPSTFPSTGSDSPVTVQIGSKNMEVITDYCIQSTYCTTSTRHLHVRVNYQGNQVYEVDTVFTQLN